MVRHLETAVLYDSADNRDLPRAVAAADELVGSYSYYYRVRTTTSPLLGGSRNDVTV